jgi:hypothetical protein
MPEYCSIRAYIIGIAGLASKKFNIRYELVVMFPQRLMAFADGM